MTERSRIVAPRATEAKFCEFPDCGRPFLAKGLCGGHYYQMSQGRRLVPIRVKGAPKPECSFDGCDRPTKATGLCKTHYTQKSSGKPLSSIKSRQKRGPRCTFQGCQKQHEAHGLCKGHYNQAKKGRTLTPLNRRLNSIFDAQCSFDGCNRPHGAKGLCLAHYGQLSAGKALTPINGNRARDGIKACCTCRQSKPVEEFVRSSASIDGYYSYCRECSKWKTIRSRYGIDKDDYQSLLSQQGFACAICRTPDPGPGKNSFAVDHDHSCCPDISSCGACVRGLLCMDCNVSLGRFKDDPALLRSAIEYLENHLDKHVGQSRATRRVVSEKVDPNVEAFTFPAMRTEEANELRQGQPQRTEIA
ncbi:endonuclease VII domain-containing protein [Streptomyces sp. NPDC052291]|uniref:endonuclease VII domain-containing protein n=1 Tax=Streptomyces sp. NPDC052291 TaxID=3161011 RepID=UPI0034408DBD